MSLEEIAGRLGVSPGRISQVRRGPAARAPEGPASPASRVLVQRALPIEPAVRGAKSLSSRSGSGSRPTGGCCTSDWSLPVITWRPASVSGQARRSSPGAR
ncbi:hypothetical protein [Nonomuraea guangzhouensis]|uniref:RNA polymerase sigma-70 region 4 domain-containing protein n=2 Tax=Nonomuraea guangzhouensis TaxID=1291555 RepID=A0ABW4GP66_9ACTN